MADSINEAPETTPPTDFIRDIIAKDRKVAADGGHVHTRFPPEPNGYLHIGHAKSICLNFGIAQECGGLCNLRFDDTNPTKENAEYVDAIQRDVRWLGFDWDDRMFYASDYFERRYGYAERLIRRGDAYVDSLSAEEIRKCRGTLTDPGVNSPYRDRSVEENVNLFWQMRAGEFPDGAQVLRAKIDMASSNINMRDPILYRIRHAEHHRTGDAWKVFPTYDYAHPVSDAIEGITHSLATLECADHRPLYDWVVDRVSEYLKGSTRPRQIEFARLNLNYTVMSKRKLLALVDQKIVAGWDDPRMPTIAGLRRRGYTSQAIREFCNGIGVARKENTIDVALLEHALRQDLNRHAQRGLAVLRPIKVVIENYQAGRLEHVQAVNNPEDPSAGTRPVPFAREIYIERDDFMEEPSKKFFRLSPGAEVRLRYAYILKCEHVVKDDRGNIVELRGTIDTESLNGAAARRRVKRTIHWVSAAHAGDAEIRLYSRLFRSEDPGEGGRDPLTDLNPDSLHVITSAKVEPMLAQAEPGSRFQFERQGYFCADSNTRPRTPIFNRTVTLKDTWAKVQNVL
jgi:glutaminyl-tRNA synthetase